MPKKINFDLLFVLHTKTKWKWIIDLNVEHKSVKLLEENVGENVCDLQLGKDFSGMKPQAWSLEEEIDKLDFIKIKNFSSFKDTVKRMKSKTQIGRKYLKFIYLIKDLYPKNIKTSEHKIIRK